MPLDEWQEQSLEAAMGERSDGRWASKFIGLSVPRQNGKSQLIVARALAGVLLFDERMIIISAHETDTAREVWKRLIDVVEANPTLEARVTGRMDAINREFLSFGKGAEKQTIKLKARRASGSRGFSADCLLLDEAQILGKQAWGSIVPTMSARPNPQMWLFGTPPTEDDDPFAFARVRESSMAHRARHCWLEWSAEPDDDFDDPATWAKANPSFGVRISAEACADDRAAMDDGQFALERLGIWDKVSPGPLSVAWAARLSTTPSEIVSGLSLGVAVSVDRRWMRFGAAGVNADGRVHVELADDESDAVSLPFSESALVRHAVALHGSTGAALVVDEKGPAGRLIEHLREAGVEVVAANTTDVCDAYASLFDRVLHGDLVHLPDAALDRAVAVARERSIGDRMALGRRQSSRDPSADITPIEAVMLAAWRVQKPGPAEVTPSFAYR